MNRHQFRSRANTAELTGDIAIFVPEPFW